MHHKIRLIFALVLSACFFTLPCCLTGNAQKAGETVAPANTAKGVQSLSANGDFPVLKTRRIRATPTEGEIYQIDNSPLAGRKVLVLIHGGGAEKRPYMRWGKLVKSLKADPEFAKRFKIYFFRYDTDKKLAVTAPWLKKSILSMKDKLGVNQVSLICLSMGGNLVQRAMLDPQVESAVELVFAMAAPFHGSPLFSPGWFQYSLNKQWYMPWARPVHNWDYMLYFSRHKILQEDLRWDNFDELIPNVGKFKSELDIGPSGDLTPKDNDNPELAKINESNRINKSKFITYSGYLDNIYLMSPKRKLLEQTIIAPFHYVFVKLPVQLGREHPALRMMNHELSNLVVNPDAPIYGPPSPHSYVLNDGITPVSSALYLPPSTIRSNPMLMENQLPNLKNMSDVQLMRVFRDMDHISFLDGKPPHHICKTQLSDQVHPEDGERKIFQWVAKDLLEHVTDGAAAQSVPAGGNR